MSNAPILVNLAQAAQALQAVQAAGRLMPSPNDPVYLYRRALSNLAGEDPKRWGRISTTYADKPRWWQERFIAHNKRMAEKGLPGAVVLVTKVMALKVKG